MANPAVPTALKKLRGNPGHRPLNDEEPLVVGDIQPPPRHLTPEQKRIWRENVKNAPPNLLKSLDWSVFEMWVVATTLHRKAVRMVNKEGLIVPSPEKQVPMQNPWLAILNKQAMLVVKCAAEMGFTPVSRSKVKAKAPELPTAGGFSAYVKPKPGETGDFDDATEH
jgi:P27 family predicted phage terminase small subunit